MHNNLHHLNSLEIISKNFNVPIEFLEFMNHATYIPPTPIENSYSYFPLNQSVILSCHSFLSTINIPKKNNKRSNQYREVIEIKPPFNNFYKDLLVVFENKVQENKTKFIHENVHGFVKGKNILSNAKEHLNQKYILKVDIKDFFHSIKRDGLIEVFKKIGFQEEGAKLFSNLCTYKGVLKEGFNTSPLLANLYCFDLDKELIDLSKRYALNFTRYSDDMTFSSNKSDFPEVSEIRDILKKYDFNLNDNKINFLKYGQSQYVTGLSVSNIDYPRVPRDLKKRVRQKLYYLNKFDEDHFSDPKIDKKLRNLYGHIIYILGIEKELGKKYKTEFLDILESNNYKLANIFKEAPLNFSNSVSHYIDETDIIIEEKQRYFALSVVSIADEVKSQNIKNLEDLKNELTVDFRNGLTDAQKAKLFHYAEDNIFVKEKYITSLRGLSFEAFIIYFKTEKLDLKKKEYQEIYHILFSVLVYKVLRRYCRSNNVVFFEENTKISLSTLENNLKNIRGMPKFKLHSASKATILLSIPDYILGIFRDCVKKDLTKNIGALKEGQSLKEEIKLNEILDKIRLVIDLTNSKYYARQEGNKLNCRELNEAIINDFK